MNYLYTKINIPCLNLSVGGIVQTAEIKLLWPLRTWPSSKPSLSPQGTHRRAVLSRDAVIIPPSGKTAGQTALTSSSWPRNTLLSLYDILFLQICWISFLFGFDLLFHVVDSWRRIYSVTSKRVVKAAEYSSEYCCSRGVATKPETSPVSLLRIN